MKKFKLASYEGYVIGWYWGNRAFISDYWTDRAIWKNKTRGPKK